MIIYASQSFLIFCIVVAAVFGAAMGSFLNCAAWRIAHGEGFLKGRSHCPGCGRELGPAELVPVLSWLMLRGRCRGCGEKISVRYPLTELFFALVTALCLYRFGLTVLCLRNYVFLCCLFCLSLVDLDTMTIPDGVHIISAAAWVAALPFTFVSWADTGLHVLAGVVFGGGLLLVSLVLDKVLGRESLGGGDIKLVAVTGLYLGMAGSLFSMMIACIVGLAFYLLLRRRSGEGQAFPFGPSLALAAGIMLLFGEPLVRWYTGLLA